MPAYNPDSKTEKDIVEFIDGKKDEEADKSGDGSSGNEDEAEGDEAAGDAPAGDKGEDEGEEAGGDEGGKDAVGAGKPGKQGAKGDKPKRGEPKALVDPKTGKPIAQPGADRRFYEDAVHYRREAQSWQQKFNEINTKYAALNDAVQKTNSYGLAPEEMMQTAELASMWKKDPVGAIAEIITRAKEQGVDLSRLNLQSIDTNAIKQLINRELGARLDPIDRERQSREQDAKAESDAKLELDTFLDRNPVAENHLPAITNLMQKFPDMGLREAWLEVREWAHRNGIDLSKPPGEESARGERQTRKPMPSGGRNIENGAGGQQPSKTNRGGPAPVGTSLDDIIVSAMREAGINYSR